MKTTTKQRKHISALKQAFNKIEATITRWDANSMVRRSCERTLEAKRFLLNSVESNPTEANIAAVMACPIPKVFGTCVVWNVREQASSSNVQIG